MSQKERRVILIYNPVSGHGHLDSWNAIFIALLLEKGWHVLALTPNANALTSRLRQKGVESKVNLQILDWNAHIPRIRSFLAILFPSLTQFFRRLYYLICISIRPDPNIRVGIKHQEEVDYSDSPVEMGIRVRAALKKAKYQPEIALNMYMDTYSSSHEKWNEFSDSNLIKWTGIRFVPDTLPLDACYTLKNWKGMCILDREVERAYSDFLPEKFFCSIPDVTEIQLPDSPSNLTQKIVRLSKGRKIIFLGGSIGGQKNLARWLELIGIADSSSWYFVQIGEIHRGTLIEEDRLRLDQVLNSPPENLFIFAHYMDDERNFNELISISDVIFAVYREFKISSNMLGKAAYFRKPIIVSSKYLLGQRVREFGIGMTVSEDDANEIMSGINSIVNRHFQNEAFQKYCDEFSITRLGLCLEKHLSKCMGRAS